MGGFGLWAYLPESEEGLKGPRSAALGKFGGDRARGASGDRGTAERGKCPQTGLSMGGGGGSGGPTNAGRTTHPPKTKKKFLREKNEILNTEPKM